MVDRAPVSATSLFLGGFIIITIILGGIVVVVVLSLIPTFVQNNSVDGYGSVFAIDAMLLKMIYNNISYTLNGTVANSSDFSSRCTGRYQALGIKYFLGCVLYNAKAYGPYSTNTSGLRRRRDTTAGMFVTTAGYVYFKTSCGGTGTNTTSNSTGVNSCLSQAFSACNKLMGVNTTSYESWPSSTQLILEAIGTDGIYHTTTVNQIYSISPTIAYNISNSTLNLDNSTKSSLQTGCRFVGSFPLSTIYALLANQTSSSNLTTDATTQPTG